MSILRADFYLQSVEQVARQLLGKRLVVTQDGRKLAGKIIETEAYLPNGDSACHGTRGQTPGNRSMFQTGGITYVYPIHAKFCFNVVTGKEGQASAVLIRAIEPTMGFREMQRRRQTAQRSNWCSGPGKLCQALGIDKKWDGVSLLTRRSIWIDSELDTNYSNNEILATPRIGVTSAKTRKLRFVVANHPLASGPKKWRARRS